MKRPSIAGKNGILPQGQRLLQAHGWMPLACPSGQDDPDLSGLGFGYFLLYSFVIG